MKNFIVKIWVKIIYPLFHRGWSTWDGYEYFKYLPEKRRRLSVIQTYDGGKTKWTSTLIDLKSNRNVAITEKMEVEIMKHLKMLPRKLLERIAYLTIK